MMMLGLPGISLDSGLVIGGGVLQVVGVTLVLMEATDKALVEWWDDAKRPLARALDATLARLGVSRRRDVRVEGQPASVVARGLRPTVLIGHAPGRSDAQRLVDAEDDLKRLASRQTFLEERVSDRDEAFARVLGEAPIQARAIAEEAMRVDRRRRVKINAWSAGMLLVGIAMTMLGTVLQA